MSSARRSLREQLPETPFSVLLTGGSGQLGSAIMTSAAARGFHILPPTRREFDVTQSVRTLRDNLRLLFGRRPAVVIHCAAVADWRCCHDDPEKALEVNALGALNVARLCEQLDVLMVYISTDAVFSGAPKEGGYTEVDIPTSPVSVYGATKLAGEHLVIQTCRNLIVRVGWLFSDSPASDKKFVGLILRQAAQGRAVQAVTDKLGSPSYAPHVAARILEFSTAQTDGVRHLANQGGTTRHDFAQRVLEVFGYGHGVVATTSDAFPDRVRRPNYSVLATNYTDTQLPTWQQAVEELATANPELRARWPR
jgi:dTDP-4-dehydrorhamnose reductase